MTFLNDLYNFTFLQVTMADSTGGFFAVLFQNIIENVLPLSVQSLHVMSQVDRSLYKSILEDYLVGKDFKATLKIEQVCELWPFHPTVKFFQFFYPKSLVYSIVLNIVFCAFLGKIWQRVESFEIFKTWNSRWRFRCHCHTATTAANSGCRGVIPSLGSHRWGWRCSKRMARKSR